MLLLSANYSKVIVASNSNVLWPGHHYQKFKFHQQQEALAAHFNFTPFSAWFLLDSWLQLFTPVVGFHFFFSLLAKILLCNNVIWCAS